MAQLSFDPYHDVSLADVEAMRLLLKGHSVIDWHYLSFSNRQEVERFLCVNEFDINNTYDIARLERLRTEAVEYLTRHLDFIIDGQIDHELPVIDLFLIASKVDHRLRTQACAVLKVMHVIHHLEGREILFRLPISDDQVFSVVESKVVQVVEQLRSKGYPIVEFAWSRKEHSSLVTKLLAKKESIAARVYDKLRFRLVTKTRDDLMAILCELTHQLVPFNYVVPGQTVNRLLNLNDMWRQEKLKRYQSQLQPTALAEPNEENVFSGAGYKVLNFVADLPIRLETLLKLVGNYQTGSYNFDPRAVVFVLTEFQLLDEKTDKDNEQAESGHAAYKQRQKNMVRERLSKLDNSLVIARGETDSG